MNKAYEKQLNNLYCVDFLQYIKNNAPLYYNMIINKIDKDYIKKNWNNGTVYPQRKKQAKERERRIIALLELGCDCSTSRKGSLKQTFRGFPAKK